MRASVSTALVLFLIVLSAGEDGIVSLDSDSFDPFVKSHNDVFVKLFSPGCHFCQELAPRFVEAAELSKKELPGIEFAEVDVVDNPRIGRLLKLKGVPTLVYYKRQTAIPYTGRYTTEELASFAKQCYANSKEGVETIQMTDHAETLKKMIAASPLTLVTYVPESARFVIDAVGEATSEMVNLTRRVITDEKTAEAMGVRFPSLVLYRGVDSKATYDGNYESAAIRRWILVEELPLIVPYTPAFSKKAFNKDLGMSVYVLFFAAEQNPDARTLAHRHMLEGIASRYRGRLVILHIPAENSRLLDYFGIRERQVPTIGLLAYEKEGNKKFMFKEELSESNVIRFIEGYFHGRLSPFLRSEEEPEAQTGPVFKIVGSTFERVAYDTTKDVVVRFFAAFDGKSKDLEPVFEEVAASYAADKSVVFAEMDVTKNEAKGVSSFDFPRVVLFKAGGNGQSSVVYDGAFEVEQLRAFVEENRVLRSAETEEL